MVCFLMSEHFIIFFNRKPILCNYWRVITNLGQVYRYISFFFFFFNSQVEECIGITYCHSWERIPTAYSTGILSSYWRRGPNYLNVITRFWPKCFFPFLYILMLLWLAWLKATEFTVRVFHKVILQEQHCVIECPLNKWLEFCAWHWLIRIWWCILWSVDDTDLFKSYSYTILSLLL